MVLPSDHDNAPPTMEIRGGRQSTFEADTTKEIIMSNPEFIVTTGTRAAMDRFYRNESRRFFTLRLLVIIAVAAAATFQESAILLRK